MQYKYVVNIGLTFKIEQKNICIMVLLFLYDRGKNKNMERQIARVAYRQTEKQ